VLQGNWSIIDEIAILLRNPRHYQGNRGIIKNPRHSQESRGIIKETATPSKKRKH
jgi:hypothetical protein